MTNDNIIRIELFTSNVCPKCQRAKQLLSDLVAEVGAEYFNLEFVDVTKNIDHSVEMGILTTPSLVINQELYSSTLPDKTKLKVLLERSIEKNNH